MATPRGPARLGMAGQGKASQDKRVAHWQQWVIQWSFESLRLGAERHGTARQGKTRQGLFTAGSFYVSDGYPVETLTRSGSTWNVRLRRGKTRQAVCAFARVRFPVALATVGRGTARRGRVRSGQARQDKRVARWQQWVIQWSFESLMSGTARRLAAK